MSLLSIVLLNIALIVTVETVLWAFDNLRKEWGEK